LRILISLLFIISTSTYAQEISLGVVPQESPSKLFSVWKPIAQYLSRATGEKIVFKTERSIPLFEKSLLQGSYDFAYVNPAQFIQINRKMKYSADVRARKNIVGILVGRESKDIQVLLKEEPRFLFPAPNAFASSVLIKYELSKKFGYKFDNPKKIGYIHSHDSVYKGVMRGLADLGGGIERTLDTFFAKHEKELNGKKEHLSIVYRTKAYPSHPFSFHPRVDSKVKEKIITALINMPENLKESLKVKEFILINNQEYKSVERLMQTIK